ncbi:MAG: hypothetical protein AB3N16_00900 [Flavobacteriaceae bacterium]
MKSIRLVFVSVVATLLLVSFQDNGVTKSMERGNEGYADFCVT